MVSFLSQRHQPGAIRPDSADAGVGPAPDQAPHRGPVRRFLRGVVPPEKRLPVAHAACGLPRLAHLLQVFSAMERAARPGFPSGAGLKKKIGWRGPAKQSERATSFCIVDSQSVKNTPTRAMTRARRCPESSVAVDTQGLPHAIHITTANVTDRAGAYVWAPGWPQPGAERWWMGATPGSPLLGCESRGGSGETQRTAHRGARDGWWSGLSQWLEKCRRNCERKLNTSLQMVVLGNQS